jgi:hypothetical protein
MTHTFSKSVFYSFGDIPLSGPLPLIFSQLQGIEGRGNKIFLITLTFTLWSSKTYSTGQALSRQGRGRRG